MDTQKRTSHTRRDDYQPTHPQEQFIVPLLREHIERLFGLYVVPAPPGGRALDVGCGRQPFRAALEKAGYLYTGLDVEQNPEGTVDIVCPIDQPLPAHWQHAQFQFVLCTEVLEHVADWNAAFKNLQSLTAPGGLVLLTCPHVYPLHEEPYDFWRPTPHTIRVFAERFGFEVCEQEAAGDAWAVLGTLLATSSSLPRRVALKERVANKIVGVIRARLFQVIKANRLQKLVSLRSPIYLSNIAVLRRSD